MFMKNNYLDPPRAFCVGINCTGCTQRQGQGHGGSPKGQGHK